MTESMSSEQLHARLAEITERSLSRTSRYGHVAMTTVAVLMSAMLAYLLYWLPSEALGDRFRWIVFIWSLFGITCAWLVLGVVVLSRRRPLLGYGEVASACAALIFSLLFTGGVIGFAFAAQAADVHWDRPHDTFSLPPLAWLGFATTFVAFVLCVHALLRHSRLQALRERLERELAGN